MANTNQQAAYPPKIRARWYFLVNKAGKTVGEVCGLYAISRKWGALVQYIDRSCCIILSRPRSPGRLHSALKVIPCDGSERAIITSHYFKEYGTAPYSPFSDFISTALCKFFSKTAATVATTIEIKEMRIPIKTPPAMSSPGRAINK